MEKLIKVKPTFNRIVTTMNVYEEDQMVNGVIDTSKTKGSIKEYQTVVAIGDTVRGIAEGDVVIINPTRYKVMKHNEDSMKNGIIGDNMVVGYQFNTIELEGVEHLVLFDQDVTFVVKEMEEVPSSTIEVVNTEIIQ